MFKTKIREYLTHPSIICKKPRTFRSRFLAQALHLKIFLFYKFKLSLSNCVFSFLDASLGMK